MSDWLPKMIKHSIRKREIRSAGAYGFHVFALIPRIRSHLDVVPLPRYVTTRAGNIIGIAVYCNKRQSVPYCFGDAYGNTYWISNAV